MILELSAILLLNLGWTGQMDWNLAALIPVFGEHGLIRQVSFPDNMADAVDVQVSLVSESTKVR